jgi:hypothetical protein
MKTVISVVSVIACAFSLDAQITATFNRLPNGSTAVRIRNNSATGLVAFVVTVKQAPLSAFSSYAPFVVYSDPLLEPAARPLPASEERVVMTEGLHDPSGRRLVVLEEPIITAGILADGTTTGDPALLTRLILRRSNMLAAVETSLETLSDAGRHNVPRDQIIEQFKRMAGSMSHWYLPPEQLIAGRLYQSIVGKLMNLPEGPLGSAFPPTTFVEQETAMLNRQRVALSESQPSLADAVLIER